MDGLEEMMPVPFEGASEYDPHSEVLASQIGSVLLDIPDAKMKPKAVVAENEEKKHH